MEYMCYNFPGMEGGKVGCARHIYRARRCGALDSQQERDLLREAISQLVNEQIRFADLRAEANRDIDWLSDTLGDYFTNCDLDAGGFIERNSG